MYEHVLLPIDGTDADDVVVRAASLARSTDATVHLLYVVDDRAFLTLEDADDAADRLRREGETTLADVRSRLEAAGLPVVSELRWGSPGPEIVDYAESAGVDVVVMGAHADYEDNMLGSVSQHVLAQSPVPVLTVRLTGSSDDTREVTLAGN
ncbi:universal stress protein [Halobium salinum]|uniref:Universal stress protein n=1 Tax=Halobium salinum TaxID=1364940 RepID=A0ABD5P9W1_9EURY|nr:universal stress protein [Halobium salinum]